MYVPRSGVGVLLPSHSPPVPVPEPGVLTLGERKVENWPGLGVGFFRRYELRRASSPSCECAGDTSDEAAELRGVRCTRRRLI